MTKKKVRKFVKSNTKPKQQQAAIARYYAKRQCNALPSRGEVSVVIKTHSDSNGGHPHVILGDVDDCHVSVGLSTKKSKGKGSTNYELEKSPLNDGIHSYMRRQGFVRPQREYRSERRGTMSAKDFAQATVYGNRALDKYIAERKKKKRRAKR